MSAPKIDDLIACLPIDAIIKDSKPHIEWLNMTGIEFCEPFFDETVARTRRERPHLQPLFTDLSTLLQAESLARPYQPSGFIFHTSRCGSTLVANACRALDKSRVIAEAPAIDKLVSRLFTDAAAGSAKELLYLSFIRASIHLLGPSGSDGNNPYIVKFACTSILQIKLIRRIWPDVPFLVLYRHPLDVTVSNLRKLPQWMNVSSNPHAAAAIAGVTAQQVEDMSDEEFCTRALARYYSSAESAAGEPSTMLVDYEQLSLEMVRRILDFFGLKPLQEELVTIAGTMRLYSKDSTRVFQPDGMEKKAHASEATIEMVETWAMPGYNRLSAIRTTSDF